MGQETPSATALAILVLKGEQSVGPTVNQRHGAIQRTFEKLNVHLSVRLGSGGYRVLLERAVTLAAGDFPWLTSARVTDDGNIEGVDDAAQPQAMFDGSVAILARLIELLDTFIGRNLTSRILNSAWPDAVPASWQGESNG